jgi:putative FmdB family regulatory protein
MPIYEYQCEDCKHTFSTLRPMNQADAPADCEQCGGCHTHRTLSVFVARSGGQAVAGTSGGSCGGCTSNSCGNCHRT